MRFLRCLPVLLAAVTASGGLAAPVHAEAILEVQAPALVGVPFEVSVIGVEPGQSAEVRVGDFRFPVAAAVDGARVSVSLTARADAPVELWVDGRKVAETGLQVISGWWSIVPALLAILAAVLLRSVVPALFLGIWAGAWCLAGLTLPGVLAGLLDVVEVYGLAALVDPDHGAVILFTFLVGGMIGVVTRNGGMAGLVDRVTPWAGDRRRAQLATAGLGTAIFFDDYANTLVIGNAMRPVTDSVRISREKLAFLVDATAAPVASVALITSWIGYELGLLRDALARLDGFAESAYLVFLNSLAYSFYPFLMLLFVFSVAATGRDFGAMRRAELRAYATGELRSADAGAVETGEVIDTKPGVPRRMMNAAFPVLTLVVTLIAGLLVTGEGETLRDIVGSANSYTALMWASLLSGVVAVGLTLSQGILDLRETMEAWGSGAKATFEAMVVLVLAWTLGSVIDALHAPDFLVSLLGDRLPVAIMPSLVFLLAAATAFATGTSFGTMGILMPLAVPLTWAAVQSTPDPAAHTHLLYSAVACVLTGAVWGDHCSPISDTTILSSLASRCDHLAHVATQLPYAVLVGAVALLLGTLPAGLGVPSAVCMLLGAVVVVLALRLLGEKVDVAR